MDTNKGLSAMAIPDWQGLMLPALKVLSDKAIWSNRSVYERLARDLKLTPSDVAELIPSKTQSKFQNRASWALFDMTQAGLLESVGRGQRRITSRGIELLSARPASISRDTLKQFPEYAAYLRRSRGANSPEQPSTQGVTDDSGQTPDETLEAAFEAVQEPYRDALLKALLQADPELLERLALDVLSAAGYGARFAASVEHLGKSHDGGVDGRILEDPLGFEMTYVQAKRYDPKSSVDVKEVRAFAGALDEFNTRRGVFVTTSDFTGPAREFAAKVTGKKIVLINGTALLNLMFKYGVGVRTIRTFEVKALDQDYFVEE